MLTKILEILNNVCDVDEVILQDTELIDSGILDSLAKINFFNELEDIGIQVHPTMIESEDFKTAKLIAASLKMGAIICEYDLLTQEKLYNFGIDLGLLFQIQDDIIDETCSEEEAGKTTKNDEAKNSFVNLLGLQGAIKSADDLALKCINILETFDLNLKESLEELLLIYINRHK